MKRAIKIVDELASLKRPRKDELKRRLQLLIGRKRGQLHFSRISCPSTSRKEAPSLKNQSPILNNVECPCSCTACSR